MRVLKVTLSNGESRIAYPWNLLPLDIYRSQNTVQRGARIEQEMLTATMNYFNDPTTRGSWRPIFPKQDTISKIEFAEIPNPFSPTE